MRKQDLVPGEGFLVQQYRVLAGMEGAAGAACHPPGLCAERALLLLFTVKLLLRDTLMKYKCETCFRRAEPGDEQRVCAGGSSQPFPS